MSAKQSKYKREYCEMLIEHMKDGGSFEAFGAVVRVTEETLNGWCSKFPEFKIAKDLGKRYEMFYWEDLLKKGAFGQLPNIKRRVTNFNDKKEITSVTIIEEPAKFNATAVIFALKCKFPRQWRDKQELEITSKESIDSLSNEEITRRKNLYANLFKNKA